MIPFDSKKFASLNSGPLSERMHLMRVENCVSTNVTNRGMRLEASDFAFMKYSQVNRDLSSTIVRK